MKLKPFKEMIALSKDKLNEALAPVRAGQVKAKADLETLRIEAEIIEKEARIQELCVVKDVDIVDVLNRMDAVALLERRKKQLGEVVEQLFPKG